VKILIFLPWQPPNNSRFSGIRMSAHRTCSIMTTVTTYHSIPSKADDVSQSLIRQFLQTSFPVLLYLEDPGLYTAFPIIGNTTSGGFSVPSILWPQVHHDLSLGSCTVGLHDKRIIASNYQRFKRKRLSITRIF
jgi:hypothetical protein